MSPDDKTALEESLANIQLSGLSVPDEIIDKIVERIENGTFNSDSFIQEILADTQD